MFNYKQAFALILLTAFTIKSEGLCINSWSDSSSTWNTSGNWGGGCVPGQSGTTAQDSASFTNSAAAIGNTTITLDINGAGLSTLVFNSTMASYTITPTGTDYLQFNGASSTISGVNGGHSIATPIQLNNTTLNISVTSVSGVFFSGQLTDLGTSSITVTDPGSFTIQGTVAGTTITINGDFSVTSNFLLSDVIGASTSTIVTAPNLLMSSSATITNFNSSTITTNSFVANEWDITTNISINGATLNNTNQGPLTGVTHTSGNRVGTLTADFTLSQGAIVNSNSGNISGGMDVDGNQVIAANMTLSSNGSFSNNNNGSVSSAVSGDGNYIDLSGTLTLNPGSSFANSNSGSISGGSTSNGNECAVADLILNGGTLTNENSGAITDDTNTGNLIDVAGNITVNSGTLSNMNTGSITSSAIGNSIQAGGDITIAGGIVTNINTGSVAAGSYGSYISAGGNINVTGGSLSTNSVVEAAALNIQSPGSVTGTGFLLAPVSNNGTLTVRTLDPAPGVLEIAGNYTQGPAGILIMDIVDGSTFSQLFITGTAALNGTLDLNFTSPASFTATDTVPIIVTEGGITGAFSNVIVNSPDVIVSTQIFDGTYFLTFSPTISNNYSQLATSLVLNAFNNVNTVLLQDNLSNLGNRIQYQQDNATSSSTPSVETPISAKSSHRSPEFLTASASMAPDLSLGDEVEIAAGDSTQEKQEQLKRQITATTPESYRSRFYVGPRATFCGTEGGKHHWALGANAGYDYAFRHAGLGAVAGYQFVSGHQYTIEQATLNVYGTYVPTFLPNFAFDATVGGYYDWARYLSSVGTHTKPRTAVGTPAGNGFNTNFDVKYTIRKKSPDPGFPDNLQITPMATLSYCRNFTEKYNQSGGGTLNKQTQSSQTKYLNTLLSLRVFYKWVWGDYSLAPDFNVGWRYNYFRTPTLLKSRQLHSHNPWSKKPQKVPGANEVTAGVDWMFSLFGRYGIELSYNFAWNKNCHSNSLVLYGNYRF